MMRKLSRWLAVGVACLAFCPAPVQAWPMVWAGGPDGQGGSFKAEEVFNIQGRAPFKENRQIRVQLADCSVPANILWPGDKPTWKFQVENLTNRPMKITGKVDVIQYAMNTPPGEDFFVVNFVKIADVASVPFTVDIPANGFKDITFNDLKIPETFGGYGLVFDFGTYGRLMGATAVRVIKPSQTTNPQPYPRVTMESGYADVQTRLGAVSNRTGVSMYPPSGPEWSNQMNELRMKMGEFKKAHITTTIEFGGGPGFVQPWGVGRGGFFGNFKDAKGNALGVNDLVWLPKYDKDFQEQVRLITTEFGWPKGPIVGVKLFNEPWEGGGISGYGCDLPRYREMYEAMAKGVEQAREQAKVSVLIGGCDSSSNTMDKLFAKGVDDEFLKWLDFTSMHYQGMCTPAGYKPWRERKDANGNPAPVRMWDTESWTANSDERIAAVFSTYCSVGYDRIVGVFSDGFIQGVEDIELRTANGSKRRAFIKRPWSVCAAVAAFSTMIGDRPFNEMMFKNGLPWVLVFDGMAGADGKVNREDGSVVVIGDLAPVFGANTLPFRTVARKNAKMVIQAPDDSFGLFDSYANPVPTKDGVITLPLDGSGFYLRGNGQPGSFDKLLTALKTSRLDGIDPVEIKSVDFLSAVDDGNAQAHLIVTNVLNRPVTGTLNVSVAGLTLKTDSQQLTLEGGQTLDVLIPVTGGKPTADNSYALSSTFSSTDGKVTHAETHHANIIVKMSPSIDGDLKDWESAFAQPVSTDGVVQPSAAERAWRPWEKVPTNANKGLAVGYMGYDDTYFYFAAKIVDDTPDAGMHRMEGANDDEYFYPETVYDKDGKAFKWPEGVRRYTYAAQPDLPSGNSPNHDNVQVGFNVLTDAEKDYIQFMPGTRPDWGFVPTNDFEYALNPISAKYGGGTEIWRLHVPGMPEKNFYPRQPVGPLDGPVKDGKLAIKRDASTRYVECAIPWTEIPQVKRALDNNQSIKFSFRVNDNAGVGCMELARNRSISRRGVSFGVAWMEHWTNQVPFVFQK